MATILDNLRELIAPTVVSALSRLTGENESAISRGLGAAIPAIGSTIADRADDTGFMANLADFATKTVAHPHPLETLAGIASSPGAVDTSTPTGGWLSSLFGHNLSDVTDSVARYAGLSTSSAASVLTAAGALVIGYIGRLMRSENLGATGLSDLFRRNRAHFAAAVPSGFTMPSFAPYAASGASKAGRAALAVALLAVLGVLGMVWWANHRPIEVASVEIVQPIEKAVQPVEKAVGTAGTLPGALVRTLPGNMTITIPEAGSAEDRLSMFFASSEPATTTVKLDRVTFDSNSSELSDTSDVQIDNIATILRAYPNARVTIAGHADGVGKAGANQALSRARANAVSERMTADGVTSDRIDIKGYGSQKPIADNATEDGRAQNRRVDVSVDAR
jgi:outer membrane protein OmpA-like peptidoglycan-associated protein